MSDANARLRAMGFKPDPHVFVGDAHFVVSDMVAALLETERGRTYVVPVMLNHDEVAQVKLSKVQKVTDASDDELKDKPDIPDWSFDGVVEDGASRFNGAAVHGYAGSYDGVSVSDVFAQVTPA